MGQLFPQGKSDRELHVQLSTEVCRANNTDREQEIPGTFREERTACAEQCES